MKIITTIAHMHDIPVSSGKGETAGAIIDRQIADAVDDREVEIKSFSVSFDEHEWAALRMLKSPIRTPIRD